MICRKLLIKSLSIGLSILFLCSPCRGELVCTFLDVGEGESIFLESAGETALVDTGNVMTGKDVVLKLKQMGVEKLKYLIITHPHPDHMGGVFRILESLFVEKIYDNGQNIAKNPTCILYRWYVEFIRKRANYGVLKSGDHLKLGDSDLEVLWPNKGFEGSWNENSLVIMARAGPKRILLMGDASMRIEVLLKNMYENGLSADVLKVGHHGAADSTSTDFLDAVQPEWAVICINKDNIRGYPSSATLKRLKNRDIKVYKTYEDGDVRVRLREKFQLTTSQ